MSTSPPWGRLCRRPPRAVDGAGGSPAIWCRWAGRWSAADERRRQAPAVAIQKPTDRENAVQAIVDINGHGISTSGSYRNYYELDGKRISHVIDPQTGQPITHKLVSVTVIAPTALEADGWDTGLMVLGPEKAQQVVREEGLAVYMIVKEGGF